MVSSAVSAAHAPAEQSQHRKKALFLSGSVALCALLGVVAIVMGVTQNTASELAWAGAALCTLGYALFFGWLHMFSVARTHRFPAVLVVAEVVGLYDALFAVGVPSQQWPARGIAIVGVACALAYVLWYSRLDRGTSRIVRGQAMPEFEGNDLPAGIPVPSSRFLGTPTLFVFARGNWSALCVGQIREIAEWHPRILRNGARVVVVTPQPAQRTKALARRFEASLTFLVDEGARAARALGIVHESGVPAGVDAVFGRDTVFPTVIVTDAQGVVRYVDETHEDRARPRPEQFLAVLDQLAAERANAEMAAKAAAAAAAAPVAEPGPVPGGA
jgi:peroxiredoxin/uncharacterized membrane protein YgdD (TMEM256/DUF423 family)